MTALGSATGTALAVAGSIEEVGRAAWTELVEVADAPVFYSYDFLRSVERQPLSAPSQPYYLLARDAGGRLAAALPVYLQRTRDPFAADGDGGGPVRALLSHVWHCYDTTLPSREPLTAALVGQFWAGLADLAGELDAQLWGLVNVPLEGPLAGHLAAAGAELAPTVPRYRRPVAEGSTVDGHLAGVSRNARRTLRKYTRRAVRDGAVISVADGRDALGQDVLDLCLATADKHAPGYYPPAELTALVRRLGPACRIIRLDLAGRLLAASICLYDRSRMHAWAGGSLYPPELTWSPQYVLFAAELAAGFGSGRPMLECGRRNDAFKRRYGLVPYPLGRAVRRREAGR
jgi:hypothetical protein